MNQSRFNVANKIICKNILLRLWKVSYTLHENFAYKRMPTFMFFLIRFCFNALKCMEAEIASLCNAAVKPIPPRLRSHYSKLITSKNTLGYIIFCERYNRRSAGTYCLHKLCEDLNQQGQHCYVCGEPFPPEIDLIAPIIDKYTAKKLVKEGYVVIYPEVIQGNPLKASKIVRWCLNRPGAIGGDTIFDSHEKVFTYQDSFVRSISSQIDGKLQLPTIDESLFYDNGTPLENRQIICYYTGKTGYKPGYIDQEKCFKITRYYPDRSELGMLFRMCNTLYSFDCNTILIYEALLCGCRVVLIPDGSHTPEEIKHSEYGDAGISWWGQPLCESCDSKVIKDHYDEIKRRYENQLSLFIQRTNPQSKNWDAEL